MAGTSDPLAVWPQQFVAKDGCERWKPDRRSRGHSLIIERNFSENFLMDPSLKSVKMRVMKNLFSSILGLSVGAVLAAPTLRAQTLAELLQSIKPGQPVPGSVAPAAAPVPDAGPAATAPPVVLDTRPAFMQVITNDFRVTNAVVVTNFVIVTNYSYTTNLFNSSGQLLQPIAPTLAGVPGAVPIAQIPTQPPKPAALAQNPAALKAAQAKTVKELLTQSATAASQVLGSAGSFSDGKPRSILMPEGVTSFDRKKGQILLAAMNSAAEKAIPEAMTALTESAQRVAPPDPASLLKGSRDAATTYLLKTEGQELSNRILAVVRRTASETGVRDAYRNVMLRGGGLLGTVLGTAPAVDTDAHITRGVVAAVFSELAAQEAKIRTDPAARKTKALEDAFSH